MNCSVHIDRYDRIPALFGELDYLGDMLNAGIVDEDVGAAEMPHRSADKLTDLRRL